MLQGTLKDIDLIKFLQYAGMRDGVLVVDMEDGELRMYVRSRKIVGVHLNGVPLLLPRLIYYVINALKNTYSFRYLEKVHSVEDISISLDDFAINIAIFSVDLDGKGSDTIKVVHPDEEYVVVEDPKSLELHDSLRDFVELALPLLYEGASSRRISESTGMGLTLVMNYLTLMKIEGYVRPKTLDEEYEVKRIKIVVTGPVGAGKTTLVKTVSQVPVLETDEVSSVGIGKLKTTTALDFGLVRLDGTLIHIFGTPGQERFSFMWEDLMSGAAGYVFLVDGSNMDALKEAESMLALFRSRYTLPFVVGVTKRDVEDGVPLSRIAEQLGVPESRVIGVNATDRTSVVNLLLRMLEEFKLKSRR